MPVKDITLSQDQRESMVDAGATLVEDIHKRWPIWNELAKRELRGFSSTYMVIAIQLMAQGMVAMLCAQVPEASVAKTVEELLDFYTDPKVMEQIAAMGDDKKEILAFCDRILRDQSEGLAKRKAAN
jgi:hypothetical protein